MDEWKTTVLSPTDGPILDRKEYALLLEERLLCRLTEEGEFRGFVQRVDELVSLIEDGLRDIAAYNEPERAIFRGILEKLRPHAGKWLFVP